MPKLLAFAALQKARLAHPFREIRGGGGVGGAISGVLMTTTARSVTGR